SDIVDPARPEWHTFLLDRMAELWKRGYRAFFLDTLDSYQAVEATAEKRAALKAGLEQLIQKMAQRFVGGKLLFNRGFELLPAVGQLACVIAAESLYQQWDPVSRSYGAVAQKERDWLLPRLVEARDRYHVPVVVIDYLPPKQRAEARTLAERIYHDGF